MDGAKAIDNLVDTGKIVDKVNDAGKAVDNINDVSKGIDTTKQTSNVASEVIEGASNTADDLVQGVKETTNGKGVARNFEKTGGYSQTVEDFNSLNPTNVNEIQTKYGTGYVGTLSDGTSVVARPGSTTGGATLEIKISNSKVYKIRY